MSRPAIRVWTTATAKPATMSPAPGGPPPASRLAAWRDNQRIATDQLRDALDGDLLALWCDGHREGLDELARRHHAWLLRTVRMLSAGVRAPEAIVQDVWLDVMRGAGTYRGNGAIRSWLNTIVRPRINST
jgi:hypothetical protein